MIPIETLVGFVREDAPQGDCTSDAVLPDTPCRAVVRAKATGIIAGISEAEALFAYFGVRTLSRARDGTRVLEGDTVMELDGSAHAILLVERTALNLIGRMSGIASATRAAVDTVRDTNPRIRIAGTRKTCPGLRAFDKKAVMLGGGDPHRSSLSDQILIKDNHRTLVPLEDAVARARAWSVYKTIEVEVETPEDAVAAAAAGADIIMLDNMDEDGIRAAIEALVSSGLRDSVTIELSGGIDSGRLAALAACDVDVISMGALTHTVRNFDVSLELRCAQKTISL
ncbi:MAG: carboxylating nicotinate-nucleotide diphosphorylase [Methanomicrobiaceae archaeon]|nr:carboxylating nicotinate-nucleotide diphosphorylase [Methanomicrobiaceae archaeon]